MQVFITNKNLEIAAKELDDIRLNAQIKEAFQLLCTMENYNKFAKEDVKKTLGHINHPIFKHYNSHNGQLFLMVYGYFLCFEYRTRFGRHHKDRFTLQHFLTFREDDFVDAVCNISADICDLDFPLCYIKGQKGKDQIISSENVCERYRELLVSKWNNDKIKPKWTLRGAPEWYTV